MPWDVQRECRWHGLPPRCYTAFAAASAVYVLLYLMLPTLDAWLFGRAYRRLRPVERREWDKRMLSTIHAVAACANWLRIILAQPRLADPSLAWMRVRDADVGIAVAATTAYFALDALVILWNLRDFGLAAEVLHHVVGVVCFTHVAGSCGAVTAYWIILFEATTPLLNAVWFFRVLEQKRHPCYLPVGLTLFALYLCRVPYSAWILMQIDRYRRDVLSLGSLLPFTFYCGPIFLLILNIYWTFLMTSAVLRELSRKHAESGGKAKQQ